MIIGLGTDIVSIERIAKVLEKNEVAFIDRICTKDEKKYLQSCRDITLKLAKIWAVKEAAVKALGTGFVQGISFLDIELFHDELGKPEIKFFGTILFSPLLKHYLLTVFYYIKVNKYLQDKN